VVSGCDRERWPAGDVRAARLLTNADLEKMVDTTNEWILQRTGIRERTSSIRAWRRRILRSRRREAAMREAGITPADVGFIVVGTTTPDTIFPSTACTLQAKIGASMRGDSIWARRARVSRIDERRVSDGGDRRRRARAGGRRRRDVEHHRLHDRATCVCSATARRSVVLSPASR
jgi:hypothetical protein